MNILRMDTAWRMGTHLVSGLLWCTTAVILIVIALITTCILCVMQTFVILHRITWTFSPTTHMALMAMLMVYRVQWLGSTELSFRVSLLAGSEHMIHTVCNKAEDIMRRFHIPDPHPIPNVVALCILTIVIFPGLPVSLFPISTLLKPFMAM